MLTQEEFKAIIKHFKALSLPWTPNFDEPEVFKVWYDELKSLTKDDMREIFGQTKARKWERFPQIPELIELRSGGMDHMVARAWEKVMRVMSNTYNPAPLDTLTARALLEILPTNQLHRIEDGWSDADLQWRKKEFTEAFHESYYMHVTGKFGPNDDLPRLVGANSDVHVFRISREEIITGKFLSAPEPSKMIASEEAKMAPLVLEAINLVAEVRKETKIDQDGRKATSFGKEFLNEVSELAKQKRTGK